MIENLSPRERPIATPSIERYQDAVTLPPSVLLGSVPSESVAELVNEQDGLVTFTLAVPLEVVIRGVDALVEFTNRKFRTAQIAFPEWRVVGHNESADFSSEFCGEVLLQVTCALRSRKLPP